MKTNIDTIREALVVKIGHLAVDCGFRGDYTFKEQAIKLLEAHDEAISREIWDKVHDAYLTTDAWKDDLTLAVIRSAILGTEPARDIKPFSRDEVSVLMQAIEAEPAREES